MVIPRLTHLNIDTSAAVVPPPPGYQKFSWPRADWMVGSDTSIVTEVGVFPGGSPCRAAGLPVDPPSLLVSVGDRRNRFAFDSLRLTDSPLPSAKFLLQDLQWEPAAPRPQEVIEGGDPPAELLGGDWLGRAHFWQSGRLPYYVRLMQDALSGGVPIGHRITFGHRELLVFL